MLIEPRLLFFNHGYDFPITFDRGIRFRSASIRTASNHDVTLDGIRVQAPGRFWQHIDGSPLGGRVGETARCRRALDHRSPRRQLCLRIQTLGKLTAWRRPGSLLQFDFCTDTLYRISVYGGDGLIEGIRLLSLQRRPEHHGTVVLGADHPYRDDRDRQQRR